MVFLVARRQIIIRSIMFRWVYIWFASLLVAGSVNTTRAQNVSFSQVYASPLYLGPSFAGFTSGGRAIINFRDQWPGIPGTFRTMAFSYDEYLHGFNSGVGLFFLRDDQGGGQLVRQDLGLQYAYELPLTHQIFFRPGLQFKVTERKLDPSRLTQVGPLGETFPWINTDFHVEQFRKIDASASAMVYSDYFWLGFTLDHLVRNDFGFTDIETVEPLMTTVYGGFKHVYQEAGRGRNEQSATLTFLYRQQQQFSQLAVGLYWFVYPIEAGIWYRGIPGFNNVASLNNNDAIVFSLGFNLGTLRLAYSYDLTISDLASHSGGSNEFSLIYRFNRLPVLRSPRGPMPCNEPFQGLGGSRTNHRSFRRPLF